MCLLSSSFLLSDYELIPFFSNFNVESLKWMCWIIKTILICSHQMNVFICTKYIFKCKYALKEQLKFSYSLTVFAFDL